MQTWLDQCEHWLLRQYKTVLGTNVLDDKMQLRWLSKDSLTTEAPKQDACSMAIIDSDIGWIFFLSCYEPDSLELQVNQAIGFRSRLLRESNYTGEKVAGEKDDKYGSWRVGIVWLVSDNSWDTWQDHIMKLRRESGMAEEISFDAIHIVHDDLQAALDKHGMPRLLLHTRALLAQSRQEVEAWRSVDKQILSALQNFSSGLDNPGARAFARELEEKAKAFHSEDVLPCESEVRNFTSFCIHNFRNLDQLQIDADQDDACKAQAIVLFGPNGTGKSSFTEALSLAAFGTSSRLEQFLGDKDLVRETYEKYLNNYLSPINKGGVIPKYYLGKEITKNKHEGTPFTPEPGDENKRRLEGIVLGQEATIKFTDMKREELAAYVLRGYSPLADHLSGWLAQEEKQANETKLMFTRKHGLSGAVKLSKTAYKGLAEKSLQKQLQRPSPEFLNWLRFWGRTSGEEGVAASNLASSWAKQQSSIMEHLPGIMAKLKEKGASESYLIQEIRASIDEFDDLSRQSNEYRQSIEDRIVTIRDQIDNSLIQIEVWGSWLAKQSPDLKAPQEDSQVLKKEIEDLAKERTRLEKEGKLLRARLDLFDQSKQFLLNYWTADHPDTCPLCNSDVSQRKGIEHIVSSLQEETQTTIQVLRTRHLEMQNQQKQLDAKLKAAGLSTCPLAVEDQDRLKDWLTPFLPVGVALEIWLSSSQYREQLKGDLLRMKVLPEAPKPHADVAQEASRLATDFIALAEEADRALEDPQALGEVKKAFDQRLENVLKDHLPSTLGKVWSEMVLNLTTASWLLPDMPALKLDQRGKSLLVQTSEGGRYIRYLYNAAERHVLGLAWFFTHYLSHGRFEDAWLLLDDPAQEMDQPSFRELVRFWETLLRLHQKMDRSFTMIITLNQEERALDTVRATNGKLYILGWKKTQQDSTLTPSVKKVVLLAPGFYPLKPDRMIAAG